MPYPGGVFWLGPLKLAAIVRLEVRHRLCNAVGVADRGAVVDNTEEFSVKGEDLLGRIKELIAEGNVRRIVIKNSEGRTLIEIPLTLGVVGALIAPVAAAVGAVAALVTECTISITRQVDETAKPEDGEGDG